MGNEVTITLQADDQLSAALALSTTSIDTYAAETERSLEGVSTGFEQVASSATESMSAASSVANSGFQEISASAQVASGGLDTAARATGGLYRSQMAMAHGIRMAGEAISTQNDAIGESIMKLGNAVAVTGVLMHAKEGLAKVSERLASTEIIAAAFSGPAGWIALAAGITVAAGGLLLYAENARQAEEATKRLAEERKLLEDAFKGQLELRFASGPKETGSILASQLSKAKQEYIAAEAAFDAAEGKVGYIEESNLRETMRQKGGAFSSAQNAYNANLPAEHAANFESELDKKQQDLGGVGLDKLGKERLEIIQKFHPTDEGLAKWDALAAKIRESENAIDDAKKAQEEADKVAKKAQEEAQKQEDFFIAKARALSEETAAVGLNAEQTERMKIAEMGLSAAQKEYLDGLAKKKYTALDALAAQKKLADSENALDQKAKSMADSLRTPAEKYKDTLKEIADMQKLHDKDNYKGLGEVMAARARQKAASDFLGQDMDKGFRSSIEDSKALFNRIQTSLASDHSNPQKKMVDAQQKALVKADAQIAEQKKTNEILLSPKGGPARARFGA